MESGAGEVCWGETHICLRLLHLLLGIVDREGISR